MKFNRYEKEAYRTEKREELLSLLERNKRQIEEAKLYLESILAKERERRELGLVEILVEDRKKWERHLKELEAQRKRLLNQI
jgi:hypothetical protein